MMSLRMKSLIAYILTFDYNNLIFRGQVFIATSAWIVLLLATSTIGVSCYVLTEAIHLSAEALDVPMYFTAVILGAATSVSDSFISYKGAMKGDYDDAVANAVGSSIFDIMLHWACLFSAMNWRAMWVGFTDV